MCMCVTVAVLIYGFKQSTCDGTEMHLHLLLSILTNSQHTAHSAFYALVKHTVHFTGVMC